MIEDPYDQILIDSNFDGIFESGITNFSNFEIRFRVNGENLDSARKKNSWSSRKNDQF